VGVDEGQQARAALAGAPVLTRWLERAALAAAVIALFLAGYFGIGLHVRPGSAAEMRLAVDAAIPFVPASIWIYLALFPTALLPLFLIRSTPLYRRTIAAYALVIVVSLVVFAVYPVTSSSLRAEPSVLDASRLSTWTVATLYRLDPPYNLFPSLHLSVACLAALSAWKAERTYGLVALFGVAAIGVSICTVKQHFVVDGLAGAALAVAAYAGIIRPYVPSPGEALAYGRRGPAAYAVLLASMYAGFALAFAAR
jgi:membrane-associated phospholipid phosphatase